MAERQTRRSQTPLTARSCGFDSHRPHRPECRFIAGALSVARPSGALRSRPAEAAPKLARTGARLAQDWRTAPRANTCSRRRELADGRAGPASRETGIDSVPFPCVGQTSVKTGVALRRSVHHPWNGRRPGASTRALQLGRLRDVGSESTLKGLRSALFLLSAHSEPWVTVGHVGSLVWFSPASGYWRRRTNSGSALEVGLFRPIGSVKSQNVVWNRIVGGSELRRPEARAPPRAARPAPHIDVAEILVACTVLVGPERALRQAIDAGCGDAIARVLPYLQRAALTPHLRDLARSHEVGLKDLRTAAAEATGQEVPDIVPMRRIRVRDFVVTAMIAIAAYLVITQLAKIGFGTIADELRHAEVAWIVVGRILAQLTFIGRGRRPSRGTRAHPTAPAPPRRPAVGDQVHQHDRAELGRAHRHQRAIPSADGGRRLPRPWPPGRSTMRRRRSSRSCSSWPPCPSFTSPSTRAPSRGGGPTGRVILTALALLALVMLAALFVPALRARIVPPLRQARRPSLWAVARDRHKRLELFGGNTFAELLYALTLGAVCQAYGVDLNFAQLLFVNVAASTLGVVPVPGGVGGGGGGAHRRPRRGRRRPVRRPS